MSDELMIVNVETDGNGGLVVQVEGECDLSNASALRSALEQAVSTEIASLTLDLSEATYFDSSGLAVLTDTAEALDHRPHVIANDLLLDIFRIVGIEALFTVKRAPGQDTSRANGPNPDLLDEFQGRARRGSHPQ